MPLQATSGAASYDAFGGGAPAALPTYIEDVFSTFLYTATGPSAGQTITNNIDLSTKGGMVWIKNRTDAGTYPIIVDTVRGANKWIYTSATDAQATSTSSVTSFNTNGFTLGTDNGSGDNNSVNYAYSSPTRQVSWTFRKQPKFFDVVTYTGNGTAGRQITHNLGSTPGCIMIKVTSTTGNWVVLHRSTSTPYQRPLQLNTTAAEGTLNTDFAATSTTFSVSNGSSNNANGDTYVAYLWAHDAGGFGLTGTDNVISCGSFTETGTVYPTATVSLGWEPQFILAKPTNTVGDWFVVDTMRKLPAPTDTCTYLLPNSSAAEATAVFFNVNATGFTVHPVFGNGTTYIYIAIRRGPMKVPTLGTSVYNAIARTGTNAAATVTGVGFPTDLAINGRRDGAFQGLFWDRLRNPNRTMYANSNSSESAAGASGVQAFTMDGFTLGTNWDGENASGASCINWLLRRSPSVFDIVCYTGTGSATTFSHNLQAVPELYIVKGRSGATAWQVYSSALANTEYVVLNTTAAKATGATRWNSTTPTSSVFSIGTASEVNTSAATYVAYLFATCAGVSKVGGYTGTATTKQIDCGFTAGARFVLIKRVDSTGDWYVWDSTRGIIAGNDPYLLLNDTAAEVTSTDYVDTYSAGFEISSTAPAAINANGGSFIFLAIA